VATTTSPTAPGAPGAPALPTAAAPVITFSTTMHMGPAGFQIVAHWHNHWTGRRIASGWHPSPAAALAALGPKLAPHLNGAATRAAR
jgi:hypothetical protein